MQCNLSTRWIDNAVGHKTESPQFCRVLEPSTLGVPDPRRTETFVSQVSTSRRPLSGGKGSGEDRVDVTLLSDTL